MISQEEAINLIPTMVAGGLILLVVFMSYLKHRAKSDEAARKSGKATNQ